MIVSIITPAGANIHIPGKGMKAIPKSSPVYSDVIAVLMDGEGESEDQQLDDNEKIHRILRLIDRGECLRNSSNGQFEVIDGNIKIEGEFVPQIIAKRIIEFMNLNYSYSPLVEFWKRLRNNPSERSRTELLNFLEHNGIPITPDGYFVAYKYVDRNFNSVHDSRYKNHPGNEPNMKREDCDDDPSRTCSRGLHVATWEYAKGGTVIVAVKVDPVDVVAIPYDYNGTKMRTCRYRVLEHITGEFVEPRYDTVHEELNRIEFEYLGIKGTHYSLGTGNWKGVISHKHRLLDGVAYAGDSLPLLWADFQKKIDTITKDTRFNYLRQKRNEKGDFVKD